MTRATFDARAKSPFRGPIPDCRAVRRWTAKSFPLYGGAKLDCSRWIEFVAHLHLFLLFMLGALALNLTPGPDMTFVLAQSAHRGTRAGSRRRLSVSAPAPYFT